MKTFILALSSILLFQSQAAQAASLEEEARFLAAAREAFAKHDPKALVALTCWDGAPDKLKKEGEQQYIDCAAKPGDPSAMPDLKLIDLPASNHEWKERNDTRFARIYPDWKQSGVIYRLNLPVVKQLKITFGPFKESDGSSTTISESYPVGEKEGKLYFSEPAPAK